MNLPPNVYDRYLTLPAASNWNRLWWLPGRAPQSAELNELQSIIFEVLNKLGRTLFSEGSRIDGCQIILNGTSVTITDGSVFIAGRVRPIAGTSMTITGAGQEIIGLKMNDSMITSDTNPELLNPVTAATVGTSQFLRPGAGRQILNFYWVLNDPAATPIFVFQDGNLITSPIVGDYTTLARVLARRTYDESGNYSVNGLGCSVQESSDPSKLMLVIDAGKAFVLGFEILKTTSSRFLIDKAVDSKVIAGEVQTVFNTSKMYPLDSTPVNSVNQVVAEVVRTNLSVTRGATGGSDDLKSLLGSNAVSIVSISKVSNTSGGGYNYSSPNDYVLSGNSINWSPAGSEPAQGATYYVDLIYQKSLLQGIRNKVVFEETMTRGNTVIDTLSYGDVIRVVSISSQPQGAGVVYTEGVDFRLNTGRHATSVDAHGTIDWSLAGIEPVQGSTYYVKYEYWDHAIEGEYISRDSYDDPASLTLPVYVNDPTDSKIPNSVDLRPMLTTLANNAPMFVTYSYYLRRMDSVGLKSSGEIIYLRGVPSVNPSYPDIPPEMLALAYLDLLPNSDTVGVTLPETSRFTMSDIHRIKRQIDNFTYEAAVQALETKGQFEQTLLSKKGLLAEPFFDFSRADSTHILFDCSISPEYGECGLPQSSGNKDLSIDNAGSSNHRLTTNLALGIYTEETLIDQPYSTESQLINPYNTFDPPAQLQITPSEDYWIDVVNDPDVHPEIRVDGLLGTNFTRWTRNWMERVWTGSAGFGRWQSVARADESNFIVPSGRMDRIGTRVIDRSIIPFIRQRTITIASRQFPPNVDNIVVTFDGINVAVTPSNSAFQGTTPGTLKSNANGFFQGTFMIPGPGIVRAGKREVKAQAVYPQSSTGYVTASTTYSAEGVREVVVPIVVWSQPIDPLAQSFHVDESRWITGVGLFFAARPDSGLPTYTPVTVQLRDMSPDGLPGRTILASKIIQPSSVNISTNAALETKVVFDDPVLLEANTDYCIVALSDSNQYKLYAGRLGGTDITTGALVTKNPNSGVLFKSSNASTWDADQAADLKFRIYAARFDHTKKTTVKFTNLIGLLAEKLSKFNLVQSSVTPPGTRMTWYYSIDDEVTWNAFDPGVEIGVGSVFDHMKIKVEMEIVSDSTGNYTTKVSPAFDFNQVGLGVISLVNKGIYLTKNVVLSQNFTSLRVIIDQIIPVNCGVKIYYSLNDGTTWVEMTNQISSSYIDQGFTERILENTNLGDGHNQIRIRLDFIQDPADASKDPRVRAMRVIAS